MAIQKPLSVPKWRRNNDSCYFSLCHGGFIPPLALPAPAAAGLKGGLKETGVIMIKLTLSLWMGAKVVNGSVVSSRFFYTSMML